MFDSHLSEIYIYCLRQPLIRTLFLINQTFEEANRNSYEIILFVSELSFFISHIDWLESFGAVLHAQQDDALSQTPP